MNRNALFVLTGLLITITVGLGAVEIKNDLIRFETDIVGNFKLWTTGGNPEYDTDENQALLNNDSFGTSYVLVSVDGTTARFGSSQGKNVAFSKKEDDAILTVWDFKGVRFEQRLSLYRSVYSTQSNLMRIEIRVKNNDVKSHSVGIRLVLDSMAGVFDDEGICLPGTGLVTKGTRLEANIPSLLFVCNKVVKSPANLEVNLYGRDLVTPDLMIVSHEKFYKNDQTLIPRLDNSFGDDFRGKSAVSFIWQEKVFVPGYNDGIAIAAGVSTKKSRETQPLNLMLGFPQQSLGKESFWVGVAVENENKFWDVTKVEANLDVDSEVLELDGSPALAKAERIERAGKGFFSWKLKVLNSGRSRLGLRISAVYRSMPVRIEHIEMVEIEK